MLISVLYKREGTHEYIEDKICLKKTRACHDVDNDEIKRIGDEIKRKEKEYIDGINEKSRIENEERRKRVVNILK